MKGKNGPQENGSLTEREQLSGVLDLGLGQWDLLRLVTSSWGKANWRKCSCESMDSIAIQIWEHPHSTEGRAGAWVDLLSWGDCIEERPEGGNRARGNAQSNESRGIREAVEETEDYQRARQRLNTWCLGNQYRGGFKKEQVVSDIKWRSHNVMENKDWEMAFGFGKKKKKKMNIILDFSESLIRR